MTKDIEAKTKGKTKTLNGTYNNKNKTNTYMCTNAHIQTQSPLTSDKDWTEIVLSFWLLNGIRDEWKRQVNDSRNS